MNVGVKPFQEKCNSVLQKLKFYLGNKNVYKLELVLKKQTLSYFCYKTSEFPSVLLPIILTFHRRGLREGKI